MSHRLNMRSIFKKWNFDHKSYNYDNYQNCLYTLKDYIHGCQSQLFTPQIRYM